MRHAVEAGGRRLALRVGPAGQVAREEQRADAGDVGLERQRQQVELQLDVLVERLRHADRHGHVCGRDRRRLHRDLQPALDLAHVLARSRRGAARSDALTSLRRRGEAAGQRIENAAVALAARGALLGRAAVAEHALEHHLRIQLHRQRRRRRRPRDRVRVRAAVAFAAVARVGARILDRELHRRHQVVLADLLRDDLIDRRAGVDVGAGRLLRLVRAQERRRHPVVGAGRRPEAARPIGNAGRSGSPCDSRNGSSGFQLNGSSASSAPSLSGTQ